MLSLENKLLMKRSVMHATPILPLITGALREGNALLYLMAVPERRYTSRGAAGLLPTPGLLGRGARNLPTRDRRVTSSLGWAASPFPRFSSARSPPCPPSTELFHRRRASGFCWSTVALPLAFCYRKSSTKTSKVTWRC